MPREGKILAAASGGPTTGAVAVPAVVAGAGALSATRRLGPALALAVFAFLVYLPPAARVVQLSPDAVEYVDVARRLAAGEGYRLGVKAYHFGGTDVLHDGLAERAPLFPILVAALFRLGLGLTTVQVLNAALAALCVALVCAIGTTMFGHRTGALAGLLAAASPVVLMRMVPPMTEALSIFLTLLAVWLVIRSAGHRRSLAMLVAGAALGLGYLARPTGAVTAVTLLIGLALVARGAAEFRRATASVALGAALFIVPMVGYSLVTRGSLSYSGQTYLYAVYKDADVLRNGYGRDVPTPAEFVTDNPGYVVAAILENVGEYARLVFLDRDWLLPLLPAWPLAIFALVRREYPRAAWPVLLVAAANFLGYALTWANFQERYQLLTLLLLLPFAVDGLLRCRIGRFGSGPAFIATAAVVAVVALFWSPTLLAQYRGEFSYGDAPVRSRDDDGFRWTGPPRWVGDNDLSRLLEWVRARTLRDDALAHGQPWPLTFFTQRPATLLPTKLSPELLRSFVVDYRVAYVLLDTRDRDRRGYQPDLEALAVEGVRATSVGSYRIFDTRPLWR